MRAQKYLKLKLAEKRARNSEFKKLWKLHANALARKGLKK